MAIQAPAVSLEALVERLIDLPPVEAPFLSLYLNAQANERGRREIQPYLSKELRSRRRGLGTPGHRESYERDARRIEAWVRGDLPRSANGAAVFACSAAGVFEAASFEAPIPRHHLHVGPGPHLYPLLHLVDRYRRYAAVVADTAFARVFVFGLNTRLEAHTVEGVKTRGLIGSGASQLRFQRHVENFHLQHAKEVAEVLDRIVREDRLDTVILAGDEVIVPVLREQLTPAVASKVVDVLPLDIRTPDHEVLARTLEAFHRHDAKSDAAKTARLLDEHRAGGLGVVGVRDTRRALQIGQVDELLLSADPAALRVGEEELEEGGDDLRAVTAEELAIRARQTDATVTFIEDSSLLRDVGGVGALLRFRV